MSCLKIDMDVVSIEPSFSCVSVVSRPAIYISQQPKSIVGFSVESIAPKVTFSLSSFHSSLMNVYCVDKQPKYVVSLVCTPAPFISCIANGFWIDGQPWIDSEGWKN